MNESKKEQPSNGQLELSTFTPISAEDFPTEEISIEPPDPKIALDRIREIKLTLGDKDTMKERIKKLADKIDVLNNQHEDLQRILDRDVATSGNNPSYYERVESKKIKIAEEIENLTTQRKELLDRLETDLGLK